MGEHAPADKLASNIVCKTNSFFCSAIRVWHGPYPLSLGMKMGQCGKKARGVGTEWGSIYSLESQLPTLRAELTAFAVPPIGRALRRRGCAWHTELVHAVDTSSESMCLLAN